MVTREQLFKEIQENNLEVYKRKNNDYGNSFAEVAEEWGPLSMFTQIAHKYHRIRTLAKGAEQLVLDESLEDTLIDLANYCIMTAVELKMHRSVDDQGHWTMVDDYSNSNLTLPVGISKTEFFEVIKKFEDMGVSVIE